MVRRASRDPSAAAESLVVCSMDVSILHATPREKRDMLYLCDVYTRRSVALPIAATIGSCKQRISQSRLRLTGGVAVHRSCHRTAGFSDEQLVVADHISALHVGFDLQRLNAAWVSRSGHTHPIAE